MNITMTITADTPVELFSTIKDCNAMIVAECPVATPDKPVNPTSAPAATAAVPIPQAPVQSMPATPTLAPTPMPPVGQTAPVAPIPAPVAVNPIPAGSPAIAPAPVTGALSQTAAPTIPNSAAAPTAPMPTAPLAEAPKFTIDEITKAGGDFAQNSAANRGALINLLQQFGVQAVTQLRPEQIGPFATALRGLGAKI